MPIPPPGVRVFVCPVQSGTIGNPGDWVMSSDQPTIGGGGSNAVGWHVLIRQCIIPTYGFRPGHSGEDAHWSSGPSVAGA